MLHNIFTLEFLVSLLAGTIRLATPILLPAAQQLGMQLPDETQLRVVNLTGLTYGTTAQSADNGGAGEIMD